MSANVCCAGGGEWDKAIRNERGRRLRYETTDEPCNWKGERFGTGDADLWDDPDIRDAQFDAARTRKPCPRCGGKVQLIQPQPNP